jgi:hypothetical protein
MPNTIHTTALGVGIVLLLAGCGGQPDDAPAQTAPRVSVSIAPARSAASAAMAPTPPSAVNDVAAAAPDGEMPQLRQQLALLKREVAEIRQQLTRLPGAALSTEPTPDPRTDPNARLEAERVEQQRIASTDAAFRGEKEDARWSQGTVSAVRAALGEVDESFRNQVRSVECRSQSCRVVIGGDNSGRAQQDLSSVMNRLAATLPKVTAGQIDAGDGQQAMVLYLSR